MKKFLSVLLIILFISSQSIFASEENDDYIPEQEAMNRIVSVVADCLSSTFVLTCSEKDTNIPSSSVTIDDSGLPIRVSFFLVDPVELKNEMAQYANIQGSILSNILAIINKTSTDPFVTAVYVLMSAKNYQEGEFYLSGSTYFEYPRGATIDSIANIWLDRQNVEGVITLYMDLSLFCRDIQRTVVLKGDLLVYVDENKKIVIQPGENFLINGEPSFYSRFTF